MRTNRGKRRLLTAGAEPRKSSIVKGGGITKAIKVGSGEFSGSGMDARNAFLALNSSSGLSVFGGVYYISPMIALRLENSHDTYAPTCIWLLDVAGTADIVVILCSSTSVWTAASTEVTCCVQINARTGSLTSSTTLVPLAS